MANFDDLQLRRKIWEKGKTVETYDSAQYRQDAAGAWIAWESYGDHDSVYGWDVDHIFPQSLGGNDDLQNLRPMNWRNNVSKSDNYPHYDAVIVADGNKNVMKNVKCVVHKDLQSILNQKYHYNDN